MVYQELIERMEDFPLFSMGKGRSVREKLESMMSGENDLTTHLNTVSAHLLRNNLPDRNAHAPRIRHLNGS